MEDTAHSTEGMLITEVEILYLCQGRYVCFLIFHVNVT